MRTVSFTTLEVLGPSSTHPVDSVSSMLVNDYVVLLILLVAAAAVNNVHRVRKKRGHVIFNYNSRISRSIFIIFIPFETGMNTLQLYVIYLVNA